MPAQKGSVVPAQKGSVVPAQKDPSYPRKRIRRARAKGSVVPTQKGSVIPALAAGISPCRAPSIALVSHISPSPLRSSRRSTNLPAPSRISATFECRLGGCTGLRAELGEIPAASAGMTDLALREYDGPSVARVCHVVPRAAASEDGRRTRALRRTPQSLRAVTRSAATPQPASDGPARGALQTASSDRPITRASADRASSTWTTARSATPRRAL